MESNALRFINAYNQIDQSLRAIYNLRRSLSFSDVVRRVVSLNSVVRKYEDKLIDYARLRNAIIHNSNEERIIAEPHDDVVAEMERLAALIMQPPLAFENIATKNVVSLEENITLKEALATIYKTGFKTIPVCRDGMISGVITPMRIVNILGMQIESGKNIEEFISFTTVGRIISELDADNVFTIKSRELSAQEALDLFYNNRKLLAIIITKNGNNNEHPLGIITAADIMDLNKVIDDYEL